MSGTASPPPALLMSVVIPTRHRNDLLKLCLERLAPGVQTLPAHFYEVIVTDNGETSTAEQMIAREFPWVTWKKGPGLGPSQNRNNGARGARGEWIVFTDDDCLPDHDWLAVYARAIENEAVAGNSVASFEGAVYPEGDMSDEMADCPVNTSGEAFWTANVAIKRSLFEELGGFDESFPFPGGEDHELYLRLKRRTQIPFLSESRIFHPVRLLTFEMARTSWQKQWIVWAHCLSKHPKELLGKRRLSIPSYVFRCQLHTLYSLLSRRHLRRFTAGIVALPGTTMAVARHLQQSQRREQA